MSKDTLILGLAAGFHYGDLRPFITSLRQTGYGGACVLFVSSTTRDIAHIEEKDVRCVPFERPQEWTHVPYNAFRYFLYQDYLRTCKHQYQTILLTDTRDVVFQRDPFAFAWAPGLNVTLEDRSVRIGDCPYMARWTAHHLGDAVFRQLRGRPISCSAPALETAKP